MWSKEFLSFFVLFNGLFRFGNGFLQVGQLAEVAISRSLVVFLQLAREMSQ